jgi:two-component sensor histidine kinase
MLDGKVVVLKRRARANAAIARVDNADIDMRQLRHHTKNALQRIAALAATTPGLQATPEGRRLVAEIERRILLTAQISDALFGLTRTPAPFADRLVLLSKSLVDLLADPDQVIRTEVTCQEACEHDCPADLHEIILRVTQELVSNAVKHGFQDRVVGRLRIQVARTWRGIRLTVADDGWGFGHRPCPPDARGGQGLGLIRSLLEPVDGVLAIRTDDGLTAEVLFPL